MSESGSSIVLKRPKQWISVELVSGTVQITATVIATYIVSMRSDAAPIVRDVGTRGASFQDGIPDLECPADRNATAVVAANRAVRDVASAIDTATCQVSIVPAKSAVSERYTA